MNNSILVDTSVLIALVDSSDSLHLRASAALSKLGKKELLTTSAVLTEAVFALPRIDQRNRLAGLLEQFPVGATSVEDESELRRDVFRWMRKYSDHVPDFADAELCVIASVSRSVAIWTYDRKFESTWRGVRGKRLTLVG